MFRIETYRPVVLHSSCSYEGASVRDTGDLPDSVLWLEASSGTESSFAVLFDRHRVRVFRKAYADVRNVADAEDIVALVFLEAWRSRDKVRIVDGSLVPWLLTVTNYVLMNQSRTARRYRRLLAALPLADQEPDHAEEVLGQIERSAQVHAVRDAMKKLSAMERSIIDLCIVESLPLAAVASLLNMPEGTVKSKLHRAREKVRRRIPPHLAATELVTRADGASL